MKYGVLFLVFKERSNFPPGASIILFDLHPFFPSLIYFVFNRRQAAGRGRVSSPVIYTSAPLQFWAPLFYYLRALCLPARNIATFMTIYNRSLYEKLELFRND